MDEYRHTSFLRFFKSGKAPAGCTVQRLKKRCAKEPDQARAAIQKGGIHSFSRGIEKILKN